MVTSEEFFFNYAEVCSNTLVNIGTISKERREYLRKLAQEDKTPSREILEESYPAAFRRIKKLAEKMGKDYWDIDVMREYWHHGHNEAIDARDGTYARYPEVFCDYCKVHVAEVSKVFPDGLVMIQYDGEQRGAVPKKYLGELKVGEKVRIHQGAVIERFTD